MLTKSKRGTAPRRRRSTYGPTRCSDRGRAADERRERRSSSRAHYPRKLLLKPPVFGVPGRVVPGGDGEAVQQVGVDAAFLELVNREDHDILAHRVGHVAEVGPALFLVGGQVG